MRSGTANIGLSVEDMRHQINGTGSAEAALARFFLLQSKEGEQ
jgi:hypothetical protein